MRSLKLFVFGLLALLGLASCEPEPEVAKPVIKVGQTEVVLPAEGGSTSIGYLIENPVEGEKIALTYEADWLTANTSKVRSIGFTVPLNESGAERSVEITISYKGAEDVKVTVKQEYKASPLKIEIADVTATELFFSVYATDPTLTWLPMVAYKATFDLYESADEIFAADLEYLAYVAEIQDQTLSDFIESTVATGTVEDIYFDNLLPENDYVIYAYGITPEGVRTTDIVSVEITTEKAWEGDITFEFEVEEENHVLWYNIIPSHTGVPYYYGVIDEPTLNQWAEEYGTTDLKTLIQLADINYTIDVCVEYGFISGKDDYFLLFNETGRVLDNSLQCVASTNYIFYAAKWNEECELIGEIGTYEFFTAEAEVSVNELTLTVDNITQSTAEATVTTTTDDPYVLIPVSSSEIEGLTDEEIFAHVVGNYEVLLGEYTFVGDKTRTYTRMRPDTDYTFLAFGYTAGTLSNGVIDKVPFKTLASGNPKDCTFEFNVTPYTDTAWVEVTPSDKGHFYYWMVCPATMAANQFTGYIKEVVLNEWYEGDVAAFSSWVLTQGNVSEEVWDLTPDSAYKVGAVIMDYDTGEFLSTPKFSKTFKTYPVTYAEIGIEVEYDKYFDIQELIDAGITTEGGMLLSELMKEGDAIMPTTITLDGEYTRFYYDIYGRDLTDEQEYPEDIFIDHLIGDGSPYEQTKFVVKYDYPMTIVAMAYDKTGNHTRLYRHTFTLSKDGASPASEYPLSESASAPAKSRSLVEWSSFGGEVKVGSRNFQKNEDHLLVTKGAEDRESAMEVRRESFRTKIDLRKEELKSRRVEIF